MKEGKGEGGLGMDGEGWRGSKGARGCECRPKHKDMWLVGYTHSRIHHSHITSSTHLYCIAVSHCRKRAK